MNFLVPQKLLLKNNNKNFKKQDSNFLIKIIAIIAIEVGKETLLVGATATMGPVGAMIAHYAGDVIASMIEDKILGLDLFAKENLIYSFGFPSIRLLSKYSSIKKWNKSYLRSLSKDADPAIQRKIYELNEELNKMSLHGGTNKSRNYQKVYEKYKNAGLLQYLPDERAYQKAVQNDAFFKSRFKKFTKNIRFFNKTLSFLDPAYATKTFTNYITKRFKKIINKKVSEWYKKFGKKFITKKNEMMYKTLIPLNHTVAPWILGIRYSPMPGMYHLFCIRVIFNAELTNHKKVVYLYNKRLDDIWQFVNAESAGQYYINNISWGWDIGKIIRNSGVLDYGIRITTMLPYASKTLSLMLSTYRTLEKLTYQIHHLDATIDKWKNPNNYLKGAVAGTFQGIKGWSFAKTTFNYLSTGETRYIKNYVRNKTKRGAKKAVRSFYTKKYGRI